MAGLSALTVNPGDVVVADFPGVRETKRRPALVVSTDDYHQTRPDAILAVLTGQVAAATQRTDHILMDWSAAGLRRPTAYRTFLITVPREDIVAVIGRVSERDWAEVQACLRISLATDPASQVSQ
ncbi:MAG: type II toxin-antitoxin system PemK/MazF family toxin [Caldilineales bacterium]|nr:type II toxin-antitoxin system PemK/MazF family toxin [Caldilineales bacterium]